jgi:hypothetical protein
MNTLKTVFFLVTLIFISAAKLRTNEPKPLILMSKSTENCLTYAHDHELILMTSCEELTDQHKFKFDKGNLTTKASNQNICPKLNDHSDKTVAFDVEKCENIWELKTLGDYHRLGVTDKFGQQMCITAASMSDIIATPCDIQNEDQLFREI